MILLIHISDIHFGIDCSPKPPDTIIAAIRGMVEDISIVFVVLSGDIAYSGKLAEYNDALEYFSSLKDELESELSCQCHIVVCPGNHDCNFISDDAIRDLAIDNIRKRARMPESKSILDECMRVQSDFFEWASCITDEFEPGLVYTHEFECPDGTVIAFRVLNSAWMSTKKEKQGALFFPISVLPQLSSANIRITVLHHPYPWFESANGRELRRTLEDGSEIILTGHEHDVDTYYTVRNSTNSTGYIEGGAFSGTNKEEPCFLVLRIDSSSDRYSIAEFKWKNTSFSLTDTEVHWEVYVSQIGLGAREQMLSKETMKFIEDPGLQLTHRAKSIVLEDIFVVPDLRTYIHSDKPTSPPMSIIPSINALNALFDDKYVYLLGEGQCGKTSLAKCLFKHAVQRGLIPVLLMNGHGLRPESKKMKKTIDLGIRSQYQALTPEAFWQKESDDRVIIVDGFSEVQLSTEGKAQIAKWLRTHFGYVYLLGDDMTQLESLLAMPDDEGGLHGFSRFEICPFGYELRDVLITKWLRLGRELEISDGDIHHQVRTAASLVNTILGKNLLPAYPMHILLILQQMEARTPLDTKSGSYGYFYETVLTRALSFTSDSPEDLDAKYTYLSELAWRMFRNGNQEFDEESLARFSREHCAEFQLLKSADQFQAEVTKTRVIQLFYGTYRFVYKCFLFYFVARYIRDNSEETLCKDTLNSAVENLHREDYANILIFYTYLTKNKSVIGHILENARTLFKGIEPCNLEDHIEFVNRIQECIPEIVLPDSQPEEQRRALLRQIDKAEQQDQEGNRDQISDERDIAMTLAINRAIKTLQVLGQILRNFSGSFRGRIKNDITQECFNIGLRVLNWFYISIEQHLDASLTVLANLFGRDFSVLPEHQRVDAAKQFIFFVSELICLSTLRRISYSIGSEKLLRTYEDINSQYSNRATRFVQLALRLDHCKHFPETQVTKLYDEVKNDVFGLTLLRMVVAEHFHFFSRPYRVRQSVCARLGISYKGTIAVQGQLPAEGSIRRR